MREIIIIVFKFVEMVNSSHSAVTMAIIRMEMDALQTVIYSITMSAEEVIRVPLQFAYITQI